MQLDIQKAVLVSIFLKQLLHVVRGFSELILDLHEETIDLAHLQDLHADVFGEVEDVKLQLDAHSE